jgi:hypothetical protein
VFDGDARVVRSKVTMQGSRNHGQAYYRCKFPSEYAVVEGQHPRTVYVREAAIVPGVDTWIATLFKDIVAVLANANPADKRAIYDELGVNLTYHPDGRVQVGAGGRVLRVRVGGGT